MRTKRDGRARSSPKNGRKGGRPVSTSTLAGLQSQMRERVLAEALQAADFLGDIMRDEVVDSKGEKIIVPIEVRERAASRLFAKGAPDKIEVEQTETKLVEAYAWRDPKGKMHPLDGVPGPEEVH